MLGVLKGKGFAGFGKTPQGGLSMSTQLGRTTPGALLAVAEAVIDGDAEAAEADVLVLDVGLGIAALQRRVTGGVHMGAGPPPIEQPVVRRVKSKDKDKDKDKSKDRSMDAVNSVKQETGIYANIHVNNLFAFTCM